METIFKAETLALSSTGNNAIKDKDRADRCGFIGIMKETVHRGHHHRCPGTVKVIRIQEFAKQTRFTKEDMNLLDRNNDGTVDQEEWGKMGLDDRVFQVMSGMDKKISKDEWDRYVDKQTLLSHQGDLGQNDIIGDGHINGISVMFMFLLLAIILKQGRGGQCMPYISVLQISKILDPVDPGSAVQEAFNVAAVK